MTVQQQILKKVNILSTILVGNGKPEDGIVFRLKELENAIERHFKKQKEKEESRYETNTDGEKVGSDLFAPCIRVILFKVGQGENLSHNERLAIAFYFLNTNHSIEETVDIFRTSPDFDESIARYQVEFAAGSGGKGKKYSMYKCAKLKV